MRALGAIGIGGLAGGSALAGGAFAAGEGEVDFGAADSSLFIALEQAQQVEEAPSELLGVEAVLPGEVALLRWSRRSRWRWTRRRTYAYMQKRIYTIYGQ